jgi:hypothetical protein
MVMALGFYVCVVGLERLLLSNREIPNRRFVNA